MSTTMNFTSASERNWNCAVPCHLFMSLAPGSHGDAPYGTAVNHVLTLNGNQSREGLTAACVPLQTDIVDRLITRYSSGDLVTIHSAA